MDLSLSEQTSIGNDKNRTLYLIFNIGHQITRLVHLFEIKFHDEKNTVYIPFPFSNFVFPN